MVGLPKSIIKKYGITKKAWSVFRGKKRSSKPRRSSNPKGGIKRNMARRKTRRSKSFLSTTSLFKYVRVGALVAPAIGGLTTDAPWEDKWQGTLAMYTGYHPRYNDFRWDRLAQGWTPFIAATLITYGIQKLGGIIRKL